MKFIEKILGRIRRYNKDKATITQLKHTFVNSFWNIKDDIEDELIIAERSGTKEDILIAKGRYSLVNEIINYDKS